MVFYAVARGKTIGIFVCWVDCKHSIHGYKNALYKKFDTKEEATYYIQSNASDDNTLDTNNSPDYYVYTDGACSNNGRKSASAGIGIYFGLDDVRNVSKKVEGKQTNNTTELTAIVETYKLIENDINNGKTIAIVSDSEYAIKCVSSYGKKCNAKGWDVDIPNKELVKIAYGLYGDVTNVSFIHISAHTSNTDVHSLGNANADKLANIAIGLEDCPYNKVSKIYMSVPYERKDEIKKLGGMWDFKKKKWYINDNHANKNEIIAMFSN